VEQLREKLPVPAAAAIPQIQRAVAAAVAAVIAAAVAAAVAAAAAAAAEPAAAALALGGGGMSNSRCL
jgi:hypothetical protein